MSDAERDDGEAEQADDAETGGDHFTVDRHPVALVDDVTLAFGDVTVFDDISFTLDSGTVTAVVGPNGSGKSTLLRVLAGLLPATEGSVAVAATGDRPIGFCPQEPAFRAGFTVRETLSFYADLLEGGADVDETLSLVGLDAVADRRVGALSGGMKRLLGMAGAVLGDPPLLVLDEPASGLDPAMRSHIFETADAFADRGVAVVLATHHLVGAETADRLLVLDHGDIVADGPPRSIIDEAGAATLEEAFRAMVGDELTVRAGRTGAGETDPSDERTAETEGEA
ncbi:ABC transporter ATP-binding protein [Haloarchaeobius litoreus]|uniref:ABC transporter ATP-binding protein n=1 Tax=Haloarchaeobius litoreus TaxID=755306 RepID=UPI002112296B|nr:ABC transporter ATP-binding protein [Haloarchaeobius litoreus]